MPLGANTPGAILQIFEYNVLGQLIGAVLGPYAQAITNEVNKATPLLPLSPADLALGVIRNEIDEPTAAGQAAMSGLDAGRFHTLTRLTGDAPPPEAMAVALRRGFVDQATFLQGIRQGRLRDEWAELTRRLATADPSPVTPLLGKLKGQLDDATARDLYARFGGNVDHFDLSYDVEGAGPSPLEAAEAARRGIIGWDGVGAGVTSFEQAVHESAYRNKWEAVFRALSVYLPPPRTVTALYREGALTHDQAAKLYAEAGLPAELVTAYLAAGSHGKTAKHRDLAETTVVELYRDRLVKAADATAMLTALGYSDAEAGFILSIEDMRVGQKFLGLAVGRIHALYVGHRIERPTAVSTLAHLGLDPVGVSDVVSIWDWERAANVKALTPAEIAGAMHYKIIAQAEAQAELVALGYTPRDAWLYLSVHEKGPLPDAPAAGLVGPAPGA